MSARAQSIDDFLDHVDEIGLFPGAAMQILQLTRSRTATLNDLEDLVAMDGVLAGRVLKVANSPLMGRRIRIGTLKRAVAMLGFDGTRDIALALAVSGITQRDTVHGRYLWQHSEVTAWTARVLAQNARRIDPDAMFVAGLLHDLGMQLQLAIEPDHTGQLLDQFTPHSPLILKAEQLHFGFTHAQLGSELMRRWRMPDFTSVLVEYHHAQSVPAGRGADPRSHAMLQLADAAADGVVDGEDAGELLERIGEHPAREHAHMTDAALERAFRLLTEYRDEVLEDEP